MMQCKGNSLYKITTQNESMFYNTNNILNHIPAKQGVILIAPIDYIIDDLVYKLIFEKSVNKLKHFYASTSASFAFKTENIFYICIDYLVEEEIQIDQDKLTIDKEEEIKDKIMNKDKIQCSIEIIQKMKLNKTYCRTFVGELLDVVKDVFLLLNELEDKICLASNIFVDCIDENLKKLFEEKLMMQICEENYGQIKHMKMLSISEQITKSNAFFDTIKSDPVSIGGLIGGKVIMIDTNECMTKEEHENGIFDNFMLHK